jgi:diguanylate cyclase (GGDEF)-like protein
MQKPELPDDESMRLDGLKSLNILDTQPEERFDRLTRMARRVFDVPIALVSLVDENRQWFKSCIGLDVSETSRDISFCGHAILDNEVFIIPDAKEDERFFDNPLVTDAPYIRFYAGCPLRLLDGSRLGTLCIIDREPREFTEDDIEILKDLAAMAERELAGLQLATVDELTKISNRRGFLMLAQNSLNLCERQGKPATLVYMDLNKFKQINDTYGHAEGDRALSAFGDIMRSTFRDSDLFSRIGGDEFVVLLTNSSPKNAELVMGKFNKAIEEYNLQAMRGYDLSFTYGLIDYEPGKYSGIEAFLSASDAIMYERKKAR